MAVTADVLRAYAALSGKQARYSEYWDYYDGRHPLVYSNSRLKEVFGRDNVNFSQNWCAVVVDSVLDRVNLNQLSVMKDEARTTLLSDMTAETELALDAEDVHKAALVCGESFIIAEENEDGEIDAYYNDPRNVHAFYREDKPREMLFAAKWWVGEDKKRYLTLYYPDHFEFWMSNSAASNISTGKSLVPVPGYEDGWPISEYPRIPVFHFRRERRGVRSIMDNIIGPQSAFNKLFSDMMVSAEFAAFKQRWIISNSDTDALKNSPNEIWTIPASAEGEQSTQVGEFGETDLGNYTASMEAIAQNISRISRLPRHYFMTTGGDPSGEALIAMEAPLNKNVTRFINNVSVTWRKFGAFLLELQNAAAKPSEIVPEFDRPETVQPRTQAEIREINGRAGVALNTSLRWEGKSQQEIDQVQQDIEDQQTANANMAQAYLNAAERNASQQGAQVAMTSSADQAPENMQSKSGLNGAQLKSVLEILDSVVTGRTVASVAVELLVSAGLERAQAELMVNETRTGVSKAEVISAAA